MEYKAELYQEHATAHIQAHKGSGLFIDMGLGKTVATLSAIIEMMAEKEIRKTLIIAPLAVARDTWPDEINKWNHTKHLRYSLIMGVQKNRIAALSTDADIYIINCENVPWLIAHLGTFWPFDYLVIDESSKFKSAKSKRFKALRIVLPRVKRITILTGTPRPNSLEDLWSQLYLIDQGERLGVTIGEYRRKYFKPGMTNGHIVYSYSLLKEKKESLLGEDIYAKEIYDKISDICISMEAKDYLQLPEKLMRTKAISLSPEIMDKYKKFEKELVMEIANQEITAANAAVMTGKLLQFSNGAIYDDAKSWHVIHNEKLDALDDILEEANGAPVLIFYSYKHDAERLQQRFKGFKPRIIKASEDIRDWNAGKIKMGIAHPRSMGHGTNLQAGGNIIVWFGLQWSLELYEQANARLHRRGQVKPVIIHHLLSKGTMDFDVLQALSDKKAGQVGLMQAIKAKIRYYKNLGKSYISKTGELIL